MLVERIALCRSKFLVPFPLRTSSPDTSTVLIVTSSGSLHEPFTLNVCDSKKASTIPPEKNGEPPKKYWISFREIFTGFLIILNS